jgi:hypothetical protein
MSYFTAENAVADAANCPQECVGQGVGAVRAKGAKECEGVRRAAVQDAGHGTQDAAGNATATAAAASAVGQLEFEFADLPLGELPEGVSDLAPKEVSFVCSLLRHGRKREAALAAGYSKGCAGQMASELMAKPRVRAFYQRCLERLGSDTRRAVSRLEERAQVAHQKFREAAEDGYWGIAEKHGRVALDNDRTLLSAAGKIAGTQVAVAVGVGVGGSAETVPAEVLTFFAAARTACAVEGGGNG